MASATYLRILELLDGLTSEERMQLIAHLATISQYADGTSGSRPKWRDVRGTAPYPALGEDAQAWISRTRAESDAAREEQLRRQ